MLKDKVCIITGSSRGIGKAIAIDFAKNGAKIVLNASSESETAINTIEEIKALGAQSILFCGDISKADDAKGLIDAA
ncbi:MAG: SDR family NAD(P)-dependent oxidoreductase, partial [Clostridia bacterium]|nr:SDR family NAD(P)-dependent oxidoreductase [Clostridia bacterium]